MNTDPYTALICFCIFLWWLYVTIFKKLTAYDTLERQQKPVGLTERMCGGLIFGGIAALAGWLVISAGTRIVEVLIYPFNNPFSYTGYLYAATTFIGLVGGTVRALKTNPLNGLFFGLLLAAIFFTIIYAGTWVLYGLFK